MAQGAYGTIRPATVLVKDVEIFYTFQSDRFSQPTAPVALDANQILTPVNDPVNSNQLFGGLYNLTLPADTFSEFGFYNLVVRPKQIKTTIIDCGVLSVLPNVKGILFDVNDSAFSNDTEKTVNSGLNGFRIEYLNSDGSLSNNQFTIVTSSNKAEPVNQTIGNTTQKDITYRFTDAGNLIFCTLTPSTVSSVKPNNRPFIGNPNQDVIISNTFFDPLTIEIELTEHDFNTLALGIFGEQARNVQTGTVTVYNKEREIYQQSRLFEIVNQFGEPLYEFKQSTDTVDTTDEYENVTRNIEDA